MNPEQKELEYVKLWMEQSKLFWSRFQTIAVIQTGVYVAWWNVLEVKDKYRGLCFFICVLGILLTVFALFIMKRDAAYMDSLAERAETRFPKTEKYKGVGRTCAGSIGWILVASNIIMYILSACFTSHKS